MTAPRAAIAVAAKALAGTPRPAVDRRTATTGARRKAVALGALLLVAAPSVSAAPHASLASDAALDRQAVHALELLVAGDVERATVLARALVRRHPRFALGQLLHAELSAAAALDGTLVGGGRAWSPALIDLLLEARARLETPPSSPSRLAPTAAPVPPAPFVQIGRGVAHVVLVDLERSVLALHAVRDGVVTRVREHYVSSGSAGFGKRREGDRKTPLGLYRIERFLDDATLPELYGDGALVLDYPNAHDRHLGRTGSGIWLHGVPRERRSRAPRSSEGCVTMSNEHLVALGRRLDPANTLVVLGTGAEAPDPAARRGARERYRRLFGRWRDERVRDPSGARLAGLADIDANDVTILETTADGLPGTPDLLVMEVRSARAGAGALTLWWSRRAGTDDWTLALEEHRPGGT